MKERMNKLLSVKSIVTLVMTGALVALLFTGVDPSKELLTLFCTAYGAIITYFFTRKDDSGTKTAVPLEQHAEAEGTGEREEAGADAV